MSTMNESMPFIVNICSVLNVLWAKDRDLSLLASDFQSFHNEPFQAFNFIFLIQQRQPLGDIL